LDFIEPGRPMQNGFIERFNGSYQRGLLDMHVFRTLNEVREHTEQWPADYNREIPHDSLGGLTPPPNSASKATRSPLVIRGTDLRGVDRQACHYRRVKRTKGLASGPLLILLQRI
jgi:hypothetical protein